MNYQNFKEEYLRLCKEFGRDTKRKIKNDLKKEVEELEYRIEHIKDKLRSFDIAYLYGERYTQRELSILEIELKFTNQLITEI